MAFLRKTPKVMAVFGNDAFSILSSFYFKNIFCCFFI